MAQGQEYNKKKREYQAEQQKHKQSEIDKDRARRKALNEGKRKPGAPKKASPAKIIPGLKKKGTKGTRWVDKLKALGKALTSKEGGMAVHYGGRKAMDMYKAEKAKARRKRAREEAANKK